MKNSTNKYNNYADKIRETGKTKFQHNIMEKVKKKVIIYVCPKLINLSWVWHKVKLITGSVPEI